MNKQVAKLLKGLSTLLVVFAIILAFLISGMRLFGFQVYGVLTGSMEPTYPVGSLIYVKDVDARTLRVNDVITFSLSPNVVATHRIVELVPDETNPTVTLFRTKGDANNDVDQSLVAERNIIGKVSFCVPVLGYMASYIQEPPGIYVAILVCLVMIGFVIYTDSLGDNGKQQKQQAAGKPAFDLTAQINKLAVKVMGKPLIKEKAPPKQGFQPQQQGYQVQHQYQPQQGYNYQQQPYQQQYQPQQGYNYQQQPYQQQYQPQQGYQQPQYPQQQYNYQQQPYQGQQQYQPQQGYQQPQQQYNYQQQPYQAHQYQSQQGYSYQQQPYQGQQTPPRQ